LSDIVNEAVSFVLHWEVQGNFATCCSESVALAGQDLTETSEGYRVLIRRSKTDQEGQGPLIAIPRGYRLRQVEAVQTLLEAAEINALVFRPGAYRTCRSRRAVPCEALRRAHGPRSVAYAGHSLRSGLLTSVAEPGAS